MKKFESTDCATKALNSAAGLLAEKDLKKLFGEIDRLRQRFTVADAANIALKKFVSDAEYKAFRAKGTALYDTVAKIKMAGFAEDYGDYKNALQAYIVGQSRVGVGARDSAVGYQKAIHHGEFGRLIGELRKIDPIAEKMFKDPANSQALSRAKEFVSFKKNGALDEWNKRPYSNQPIDPINLKIAQTIEAQQDRFRKLANFNGAFITDKPGYTVPQSHDRYNISRASTATVKGLQTITRAFVKGFTEADRAAYTSDLAKWLDMEGTTRNMERFGNLEPGTYVDPETLHNKLFDMMSTGVRASADGIISGAGDLARAAEAGRILEFNDADAANAYNMKYGAGSFSDSHLNAIKNAAYEAASLKFFGPSGMKNLDQMAERLAAKLRDSGKLAESKTISRDSLRDNYFKTFNGENSAPENETMSGIVDGLKGMNRLTQQGGSVFMHVGTIFTHVAGLHYGGVPVVKAALSPVVNMMRVMSDGELRDFLRTNGAGMEGLMGGFGTLSDGSGERPGAWIQRWQEHLFHYTGFTPFLDLNKRAFVAQLGNEIAHNAGKTFDNLAPGMQRLFGDYNITGNEWEAMREHVVCKPGQYEQIAADQVHSIPDNKIAALIQGKGGTVSPYSIEEYKKDLEIRLRSLFIDQSDSYGVVSPDARATAMLTLGTKKGTFGGEALRMATQYKSYLVAYTNNVMMRSWNAATANGTKDKAKGVAAIVAMMAGMTAAGAGVELLQQARRGKMYDWDNMNQGDIAKFVGASFLQGGGAGLATDFIYNQSYLSTMQKAANSTFGPTTQRILDPVQMLYGAAQGKDQRQAMVNYAKSWLPGQNVWYIKPLADYLIFHGLTEGFHPGALERMEQRANEDKTPFYPDTAGFFAGHVGQ